MHSFLSVTFKLAPAHCNAAANSVVAVELTDELADSLALVDTVVDNVDVAVLMMELEGVEDAEVTSVDVTDEDTVDDTVEDPDELADVDWEFVPVVESDVEAVDEALVVPVREMVESAVVDAVLLSV